MGFFPFAPPAAAGGLALQAATPVGGYALVNGTGPVISWTAPADGAVHTVVVAAFARVTLAETGGQVNLSWTDPGGTPASGVALPGGKAAGIVTPNFPMVLPVQAGSTVSVSQGTALTAGAATAWAEIWGA